MASKSGLHVIKYRESLRFVGQRPPPAELRDGSQPLPSVPAWSHFGFTFVPTKEKKSILVSHIAAAVPNPSSPTRTTGLALHRRDLPLLQHELTLVLVDKIWSRRLSNSICHELLLLVTCLLRRLSPSWNLTSMPSFTV
ncbi:hypothetical protein F2Q68_00045488 [Brassica cretica]|uniref:Uncharacterized protein n=1 Tax=Brassica cretica TaxID=69181 RepID=A0A8S9LLN2_BRACR|nr:hypothetical protein F2Q68_00045488 [Brassica cretica]